ncbi:MAG: GNAT family N-acetyltransferase, partial [Nocardiopsaceae bacterium]|nr:GNAT family N-acetyltransferase [Nocardiopsaceae bacterium]
MRIEQWDGADPGVVRGCHEVVRAARQADDPDGAPVSERRLRVMLEGTRAGIPNEVWFAAGEEPEAGGPGTILGSYRLRLPDLEDTGRAFLHLVVHPEHRRRGVGTALLRHAAQRARRHERTLLASEAMG